MRPLDVNILSKTETWITSQVRACKAMHVALNLLTFFSPQSINHAIDFKMALCKLVDCLEFNGKVALSPSHLIHTRIYFFSHSHHLYYVLLHNSWVHLLCLATQASTYFFPHPPFQSWITWRPRPFFLLPFISLYPGQYRHWQQLFGA